MSESETPSAGEAPSPAERLIELRTGWSEHTQQALRELGAIDRAVYGAVADTPSATIDEPIRRLSNAANFSKLWMGIAAGLALVGGRRGRQAAATGLVSIGIASGIVNQVLKRLYPRARPDRSGEEVPDARHVRMPDSTSFPSGHSASGFAFANGVGTRLPLTGAALRFLAAAVAYSRVHTGVHYPGDAVVGSLVGGAIGAAVGDVARRLTG